MYAARLTVAAASALAVVLALLYLAPNVASPTPNGATSYLAASLDQPTPTSPDPETPVDATDSSALSRDKDWPGAVPPLPPDLLGDAMLNHPDLLKQALPSHAFPDEADPNSPSKTVGPDEPIEALVDAALRREARRPFDSLPAHYPVLPKNEVDATVPDALANLSPGTDLAITKEWSSGQAIPGHYMGYWIYPRNKGSDAGTNVVVTDTLPAGLTYSYSWAYDYSMSSSGNVIRWTKSSLGGGAGGAIFLQVMVGGSVADGAVLTNTVEIAGDQEDYNPSDNRFSLPVTVSTSGIDLGFSHWLMGNGLARGQNAHYWLRYYNDGSVAAHNVVMTETIPPGLSLVSVAGGPSYRVSGNKLVWNLGTVASNSGGYIRLTLRAASTVALGASLCARADIRTSDPENGKNSNAAFACGTVQSPAVDLSISEAVNGGRPIPDGLVEYRLYVGNWSNIAATNVTVTDTLPAGASFDSSSGYTYNPDYANLPAPSVVGEQVVWHIGTMQPGSYAFIYPKVRLSGDTPVGSSLVNRVDVGSDAVESNLDNNSTSLEQTVLEPVLDLAASSNRLSSGHAAPGVRATYSLYFRNAGDLPAHDVVITDTLPDYATYLSYRGSAYDGQSYRSLSSSPEVSDGAVSWSVGTLASGGYVSIDMSVRFAEDLPLGTMVTNTAEIATSDIEDDLANNSLGSSSEAVAPLPPDLYIRKGNCSWVSVAPGSTPLYCISFYNNGDLPAHDVVVTDTLPVSASLLYAGASLGDPDYRTISLDPRRAGNNVVFPIGTLGGSFSGSIVVSIRVSDTVPVGSQFVNSASISTSDAEPNYANNSALQADTVVAAMPTLYVRTWLSFNRPAPDVVYRYGVSFGNYGVAAAHDVVLTDTLPVSATFLSSVGSYYDGQRTVSITPTVSGRNVVLRFASLPPGASGSLYPIVRLRADTPVGAKITNTVQITTSDQQWLRGLFDTPRDVQTVVERAVDLRASAYLSAGHVAPGAQALLGISFSNQGTLPAHDVVVTETLPVSASIQPNSRFGCCTPYWGYYYDPDSHSITATAAISGNMIVWPLGTLPGGAYGTLYTPVALSETLSEGTVITNTVDTGTSDSESSYFNNTAVYSATVDAASPDLSTYNYRSLGRPAPGSVVRYYISFSNLGELTAHDVVVTDTLPVSATFVSYIGTYRYDPSSPSVPITVTPESSDGTLAWGIGDMAPGGNGNIYLTARLDDNLAPGSSVRNVTGASTSDPEWTYANNSYSYTPSAVEASKDLRVGQAIDSGHVAPGNLTSYWISFGNDGSLPVDEVAITQTLPISATFVSAYGFYYPSSAGLQSTSAQPPAPIISPGRLIWPIGSLPGGSIGSLYVTLRLSDNVSPGAAVVNTLDISSGDGDAEPSNNTSVLTSTVASPSGVDLHVSSSSLPAMPGGLTRYTLGFGNKGDLVANSVVITDTFPAPASFVSYYGSLTYPAGAAITVTPGIEGNQVAWGLDRLEPGASGVIYAYVSLDETLAAGTTITNATEIDSDTVDSDYSNNSGHSATLAAVPASDLYVGKSLTSREIASGSTARYSLSFANRTGISLTDVVITDTLPPGSVFVSYEGSHYNPTYSPITVTPQILGDTIVWPLGTLVGGASGTIRPVVQIADSATENDAVINEVRGSAAEEETNYANNTSFDVHSAAGPSHDLYVGTWVAGGSGIAGTVITYAVAYRNYGNATAEEVRIDDTLPVSTTLIETWGSATPSSTGDVVTWDAGSVLPQNIVTGGVLYFSALIDSEVLPGALLTNTVTIATASPQTGSAFKSAITVVSALAGPPRASFTAAPVATYPGAQVTFTDTSTGDITSRLWTFGDGVGGTGITTTHRYTYTGIYTVSLLVDGPNGFASLSKSDYITVTEWPHGMDLHSLRKNSVGASVFDLPSSLWDSLLGFLGSLLGR